MGFGKDIKRLRDKAGWSAQKMADTLGVKVERLRKWEQNDSNPRDDDIMIIEGFFNTPISAIHKVEDIRTFQRVPNAHTNGNSPPINGGLPVEEIIRSKDETIAALNRTLNFLEAENERLKTQCEVSLAQLNQIAHAVYSGVRTTMECQKILRAAALAVKVDQKKIDAAAEQVGKLYEDFFRESVEAGKDQK